MAIYHLSSTLISRGKGQSAIASAAYRSGERLYSERYGKYSFYEREKTPVTFLLKPAHAPEWTLDREKLWNGVEKIEKAKNSQLAREFNIALPVELNEKEQEKLTREYVQKNFVNEGMVADVSIHRDRTENPHFHVMLTVRSFDEHGDWRSKSKKIYIKDEEGNKIKLPSGHIKSRKEDFTNWNTKEKLSEWRKNWADLTNKYLEKNGWSERITEKSYAEQGMERKPTIHEGYVARQMENDGRFSDRCEINRVLKKENYTKESDRLEYSKKELQRTISSGLTPKEKTQLRMVAKNLKVYVSYDNLMDKQRMIHNWERATRFNSQIKPEKDFSTTLRDIDETKEKLQLGKDILENQFTRIYEKYYPELNKIYTLLPYYKMVLAEKTLEEDRVLDSKEITAVLSKAQDDELTYMLKIVSKNPYVESASTYQKKLSVSTKQIEFFLIENKTTSKDIHLLPTDQQQEYQRLFNTQDIQLKTLQILEKYFDNTIRSHYPTVDVTQMALNEKEALSQVIDYYGNRFSLEKVVSLANEEIVHRFSTTEQRIGLSYLHKLENSSFTLEELEQIKEHYHLKEIYETIADPTMREYFLHEVEQNGILGDFKFDSHSKGFSLGFLANNVTLFTHLNQANEENKRRELENIRSKQKKKTGRKQSKAIKQNQQTNSNLTI